MLADMLLIPNLLRRGNGVSTGAKMVGAVRLHSHELPTYTATGELYTNLHFGTAHGPIANERVIAFSHAKTTSSSIAVMFTRRLWKIEEVTKWKSLLEIKL
jgi:hypothetical protein